MPEVPFDMLSDLKLSPEAWAAVACAASWQTVRMNLNTFARHGVFKIAGMAEKVAEKLRDKDAIRRAKVFPYQILVAWRNIGSDVPMEVGLALQDAMEIALENVPKVDGVVWVMVDCSGSMDSPVTGSRKGATTKVSCREVAGLIASAFLRTNPQTRVVAFAESAVNVRLNPRDSVVTNARTIAQATHGGTNCAAALKLANAESGRGSLVVYVSDNQSWIDGEVSDAGVRFAQAPSAEVVATVIEWAKFRRRNRGAKLVNVNLQPYVTTQTREASEIINLGGFDDRVFGLIADFSNGSSGPDFWVKQIEGISLCAVKKKMC